MKVDARASLQAIYARFPSLKVNADRATLEAAATEVLGARGAKALLAALQNQDTYLAARSDALAAVSAVQTPPGKALQQPRRAVVSGLSAGGMLAAATLAKSGYQVDAIELREGYTRQIQFSSRQALVDELSSIDPKLAEQFLERAAHLERGFVSIEDGERSEVARAKPQPGDPSAVPQTGDEMLAAEPNMLIECRVFEEVLFEYLEQLPNVTIHTNTRMVLGEPDENGKHSVSIAPRRGGEAKFLAVPDLVVVAEGSNSPETRKAMGVDVKATSPQAKMIAGVVSKGTGGRHVRKHEDREQPDGSIERLLAIAMGSAKLDATWTLIQAAKEQSFDPGEGFEPGTPEYRAALQANVERYHRAEAALVMEEDLEGVEIHGPMGGAAALFTLQQQMSNKATSGSNVISLGDFVGTGHFIVGGGMATAAVSHIERLKDLIFDLEMGVDKTAALAKYEQGVIADTLAWGKRGIHEFYPDVDENVVSEAYVQAVTGWRAGQYDDPLAALEQILADHSEALAPIGRPSAA